MNILAQELTIPAFPLGQPLDGRPRYSMTAAQARVYAWLVKHRAHDGMFRLDFRDVSRGIGHELSTIHMSIRGLVERGWLYDRPNASHTEYAFVHPIMVFPGRRDA